MACIALCSWFCEVQLQRKGPFLVRCWGFDSVGASKEVTSCTADWEEPLVSEMPSVPRWFKLGRAGRRMVEPDDPLVVNVVGRHKEPIIPRPRPRL